MLSRDRRVTRRRPYLFEQTLHWCIVLFIDVDISSRLQKLVDSEEEAGVCQDSFVRDDCPCRARRRNLPGRDGLLDDRLIGSEESRTGRLLGDGA